MTDARPDWYVEYRRKAEAKQLGTTPGGQAIEPCPFCRSTKVSNSPSAEKYFISCRECRARGPEADTEAEAVEFWNAAPQKADLEIVQHAAAGMEREGLRLMDELDQAKPRIAELEAALMPFAEHYVHSRADECCRMWGNFAAGQFRKARAALARTDAAGR